jgi:ABC-type multidrug transport system ATPase subunit
MKMKIQLKNIGKRYNYEWIFRKIDYEFSSENNYVILGANGSGKSTLLQTIAGNIISSEGEIIYTINDVNVEEENIFQHISFASPYLELFEEFTLKETIAFQKNFKPYINNLTLEEIIAITELEKAKDKQLKYFSSGMKQKVKLALAVLADSPFLLLDEPTSNLDKNAITWYQNLINTYSANKLIIVCSNQIEYEYPFCNKEIKIEGYK